jgi:osmotically-inducible protein OsmY
MLKHQSAAKVFLALTGGFVLAMTLPGCASYQTKDGCARSCTPDAQMATAVQSSLDGHAEFGPPGQIQVAALNRVVYLYGTVSDDLQRSIAKSVAVEASGDAKIVNSIQVTEK